MLFFLRFLAYFFILTCALMSDFSFWKNKRGSDK